MSKFLMALSLVGCAALALLTPIDNVVYSTVVDWAQNVMLQNVIR